MATPDDKALGRALEVLERALHLSPEQRAPFVEEACGDDLTLRTEVDSLMGALDRAGSFLETPALQLGSVETPASRSPSPSMVGSRIGGYLLQSEIASGGMGQVYLAEQESPRRAVAIKMLRSGLASSSALRRFSYEAQVLAHLDHPNIAHIYEAGVEDSADSGGAGVPWFAMEHVADAVSITEYASSGDLGLHERLTIFARVCDAVHHGHQRGILHRDLKPSNILVAASGEPKIIDFGIARSTDADLALTTVQTDVGQLVGTLQYMSPEQCEADPANLDSRSDVYSLGVVLYELLCGRLPYEIGRRPALEAMRLVREALPERPGVHNRALRGDAETILLKALAKERQQRYQSAESFARDIRCYLRSEPIEARPPSAVYRGRLFVKRNRTLVVAGLVILIALIKATVVAALVVIVGLIAVGIIQYRSRLAAERARIEAEAVSTALTDLLSSVDPNTMGQNITVRRTLDRMAGDLRRRFSNQPLVEAALRHAIGRTYKGFSLFDASAEHLEVAMRIRERHAGVRHEDTCRSMYELAKALLGQSRCEDADDLLRKLLERSRRGLGEKHELTISAELGLAVSAKRQGLYDLAEPMFVKALERSRRCLGPEHDITLDCYGLLGNLYMQQHRYERAEEIFSDLGDIARRTRGAESMLMLQTMNSLGWVQHKMGRLDDAARLLEHNLENSRRVAGEEHFETLHSMKYLAQVYRGQARYEQAELLVREVVAVYERVSGREHPNRLNSLHDVALLDMAMERYEEAESIWRELLDVAPDALGPDHPWTLVYMHHLGSLYAKQQRYNDAEPILREAVERIARVRPDADYENGIALRSYGACLRALGRYDEAATHLFASHDRLMTARGAEHDQTRASAHEIDELHRTRGNQPGDARRR